MDNCIEIFFFLTNTYKRINTWLGSMTYFRDQFTDLTNQCKSVLTGQFSVNIYSYHWPIIDHLRWMSFVSLFGGFMFGVGWHLGNVTFMITT